MGEPAVIGGKITLRAWLKGGEAGLPAFFSIDDPARLSRLAERLGWPVAVAAIDDPAEAVEAFDRALPVLSSPLPGSTPPGRPDPANPPAVLRATEEAVEFCREGREIGRAAVRERVCRSV